MRINYRSSLLVIIAISLVYLSVIALVGINRPVWGDERHFVETIKSFGSDFSLEKMTDYDQVTPPLFFYIFAAWGKLFGYSLFALRVLSLIIALITFISLHRIFHNYFSNSIFVISGVIIIMLNPYVIGTSLFVFTDMTAFLFLLLSIIALQRERRFLYSLFWAD